MKAPRGLLARLDAKLDRSGGPDACWPFVGARSRGQHRETCYGSISEQGKRGKSWRVNRLVLLLEEVPLEAVTSEADLLRWLHLADRQRAGLEASHVVCDWAPCGNPAHLAWQTHQENLEGARQRRRAREAAEAQEAVA